MQPVTLMVVAVACVLIVMLKPRYGLVVYVAVLTLYPTYLTLPLGTVDFTAGRCVVLVLLLRMLLDRSKSAVIRFNWIDVLAVALFLWGALALMITVGGSMTLENRAGVFMDTILTYFAGRMAIRTRTDLVSAAKVLLVVIGILMLLGMMETLGGNSPYAGVHQHNPYSRSLGYDPEMRLGLYRASGASGNSIVFGMCFVILVPFLTTLLREKRNWRTVGFLAVLAAYYGTVTSMSSGPLMCLVVFCGCAVLIKKPELVKLVLVMIAIIVVAAEIGSNRHFYHLIGYLALGSSATWYRARLFELAVADLPRYWALGLGFSDPGWGPLLDGRSYTDICNQYILLAVRHGALATVFFLGILGSAIARLRRAYLTHRPAPLADDAWYMASMVIGMGLALYSVGLLGSMETLFYMMLGVIAGPLFEPKRNVRVIVSPAPAAQPGPEPPERIHGE